MHSADSVQVRHALFNGIYPEKAVHTWRMSVAVGLVL